MHSRELFFQHLDAVLQLSALKRELERIQGERDRAREDARQ